MPCFTSGWVQVVKSKTWVRLTFFHICEDAVETRNELNTAGFAYVECLQRRFKADVDRLSEVLIPLELAGIAKVDSAAKSPVCSHLVRKKKNLKRHWKGEAHSACIRNGCT